ncbi:MAG: folylpolyglutamate synthase/dihydrofolate synthase family protein [Vicinamibacterales bacterium]
MTTYERLFALEAFGIKLGLENMRTLVAALGHPERACPTIHVAGTNGKGSVCAMVERALRAAGYRTGLYTSPHLDHIEERVAVDGVPVAPVLFEACAGHVLQVVDEARADGRLAVTPTFFEVTTAIAFEAFRRAQVDVAVIEVGLGGRFDATNVIGPVACAITSIALDHERHLGTTLAAIAAEKAGIAKHETPLVIGDLAPEARTAVEEAAEAAGAPVLDAADVIEDAHLERGVATITCRGGYPPVRLALAGRHQMANAATAVRLLEVIEQEGLPVGMEAIVTGLSDARWPARLEWLRLAGGDLLIDAAHNPAGAEALASYLVEAGVAPIPVTIAAMRDKDVAGMARPLARVASRFVATEVAHERSHPAGALAAIIEPVAPGIPVEAEPDARRAVARALEQGGRAVAAGSIYFVGPLRARLVESGAVSI